MSTVSEILILGNNGSRYLWKTVVLERREYDVICNKLSKIMGGPLISIL